MTPKDKQEAYDIVASHGCTEKGDFDYKNFHPAAKIVRTSKRQSAGIAGEVVEERNITVVISALMEVVKDLDRRVTALEKK